MRAVRAWLVGAVALACAAPAWAQGNSAADAERFLKETETELLAKQLEADRAAWVMNTYITEDSQWLAARASERVNRFRVEVALQAARFDGAQLPPDVRRQLDLLKLASTAPPPNDPKLSAELADLGAELEGMYGAGKYCPAGAAKAGEAGAAQASAECLDLTALENILAEQKDPARMLEAWTGWHGVAVPMRPRYQRMVELANEGASSLGFKDAGALWRSGYDMKPEAFATELDRLWTQVQPLYESLHCYVRGKLNAKWGEQVVPAKGPLPAHMLGNMWAQEWGNLFPLVAPATAGPGFDVAELLKKAKVDEKGMVRIAEKFFTSLGFEPLPETFWQRSQFTKPRDRDVVCHASAWDVDQRDDLRIKMCIQMDADNFQTVHHELGHNFYQRAYKELPLLYRDSANDGFHEAIGDVIALSVTPSYLVRIGLLDKEPAPDPDREVSLLLRDALAKVAFLPFGLLVDQWRWRVFSGEITPEQYNEAWWELREKYQGIRPAVARSEKDFDPGAKYHVAANVPYARYYIASILQFQMHRSLCQLAGHKGPLNQCTIYGNEKAGAALRKLLELGRSKPWPEALAEVTGQREMDASALIEYFAPLSTWLAEQNRGQTCGWQS
jgi:peptidyl-dipeptidase A